MLLGKKKSEKEKFSERLKTWLISTNDGGSNCKWKAMTHGPQ